MRNIQFMMYIPWMALTVYTLFALWLVTGLKKSRSLRPQKNLAGYIPISIILTAHNEEKFIGRTLENLINQQYPSEKFEIIVVADRCNDRTVSVVREKAQNTGSIRLVEIYESEDQFSPKKYAILQGIQKARYSHLVLMDADCETGPEYLQTYNQYFQSGFEVLVNIPKLDLSEKILHHYLLPERILTWSIAAAGIGHGHPFLAFGTTWGYTKKSFQLVNGFDGIRSVLSGDDDLLIYRMGKKGVKAAFCFEPKGWGFTRVPQSLREFMIQRRRHHSAGRYYAPPVQMGYAAFHFGHFILWIAPTIWLPALLVLLIKFFIDITILGYTTRIFREKLKPVHFIMFEIGYIIHHLLIAPLSFIGKIRWR